VKFRGYTRKCVRCLKPAKFWGGYVVRNGVGVLAGWCGHRCHNVGGFCGHHQRRMGYSKEMP
jgi:hypothetical protein